MAKAVNVGELNTGDNTPDQAGFNKQPEKAGPGDHKKGTPPGSPRDEAVTSAAATTHEADQGYCPFNEAAIEANTSRSCRQSF